MYEQFYTAVATTSDTFNIFDTNWDTNNGDNILTAIYRRDKSTLDMIDFKISNDEVFNLPAGPVGMLIGFEEEKKHIPMTGILI